MARRTAVQFGIAVALLGLMAPLAPVVLWSVAPAWPWPDLWPRQFDLRAWVYLLSPGAGVGRAALTSAALALLVAASCAVIGLPAGLALGRHRFPGRAAVEVLIFLPLLVPSMGWAAGVHYLFVRLGLTDSFAGVWLSHLVPALPYMVRAVSAAAATLSTTVEEAARVLGARPWQVFWHITLPRLLPGVLAGGILAFLVSFSQFLLTFFIGGGAVVTLPVVMMPFLTGSDRTLAAGISLLFCAVGLFFLWATDALVRRAGRLHDPWIRL